MLGRCREGIRTGRLHLPIRKLSGDALHGDFFERLKQRKLVQ